MGKTRLAAELAREVQRDGATVFYASGLGPAEVALAAIARAAESRRPALLVLDDADRADAEVRLALFSLREGAALVLATGLQAAALARLEPREALVLEPLDAEAVAAIAAFYAPPGSDDPRRRAAADKPRGPPPRPRGGERVGAPRGDRARRRARGPHRRRAQRGARARNPSWPGASSICSRRSSGSRSGRRARRSSARTRASRALTATTPSTSSGARGSWRSWSRTWSARRCWPSSARPGAASRRSCAPGCCPRSRAACCRAASTGRRP